jgi:threonine dehydrogenase-like Zn-dependent dehydrogenase
MRDGEGAGAGAGIETRSDGTHCVGVGRAMRCMPSGDPVAVLNARARGPFHGWQLAPTTLLNFNNFSKSHQMTEFKNRKRRLPRFKKILEILNQYTKPWGTTSLIGLTSKSKQILEYKFRNFLDFEFDLNFKGVQTSWDKSQKFTKIIICQGIHKNNFISPQLYRKIPSSFRRGIMNIRRKIGEVWK